MSPKQLTSRKWSKTERKNAETNRYFGHDKLYNARSEFNRNVVYTGYCRGDRLFSIWFNVENRGRVNPFFAGANSKSAGWYVKNETSQSEYE